MVSTSPHMTFTTYHEVAEVFRLRQGLMQATYLGGTSVLFDGVLVTLNGERHQRRRQLEIALFTRRMLRSYEEDLMPRHMRRALDEATRQPQGDLVPLVYLVSTQVAAQIIGIDGTDDPAAMAELRDAMYVLHAGATVDWSTRPRDEVLREVAVVRDLYAERFFRPALARRRALVTAHQAGEVPPEALPTDLLTLVLTRGHETVDDWDDGLLLRETIHFLVAGAHTTGTTLLHAFDDLSRWWVEHPEDRARSGDRAFLQQVVHESLRLHPPSLQQLRRVTADLRLGDGRILPAGTLLVLDLVAANRDPRVFGPDAERFNPHRVPRGRAPRYGHTFGGGPHMCIGRELAAGLVAGTVLGEGQGPLYGIVTRMLARLLAAGAAPDPTRRPQRNPATRREQYLSYPVIFQRRAG
jgi:cytochrome P450